MRAYGSVAAGGPSNDRGVPLPAATNSGRSIFDDLARLEYARAHLSPIQIQPLPQAEVTDLQDWVSARATHVDVEAIKTAYQAGQTPPQIARQLGYAPSTVRAHINASGLDKRDDRATHCGGANRKIDTPELIARLQALYLVDGATLVQIAELLHTTPKVIGKALARNNIPRRRSAQPRGVKP